MKARASIIERLDGTLGGVWWQPVWESGDGDREEQILRGYLDRLGKLPGKFGWWSVPVSNTWEGDPVYCLVQLTQHPDGKWLFHEALSKAMEEYREACFEGRLDLEPLKDREARWVEEIKENVADLLDRGSGFVVERNMKELFGSALGLPPREARPCCHQGSAQGRLDAHKRRRQDPEDEGRPADCLTGQRSGLDCLRHLPNPEIGRPQFPVPAVAATVAVAQRPRRTQLLNEQVDAGGPAGPPYVRAPNPTAAAEHLSRSRRQRSPSRSP